MATLEELLIKIGVNIDDVEKGMAKAGTAVESNMNKIGDSVEKAGRKMDEVGKKTTQVGKTLTKSVTLPLAAIGVAAFKTASDFETSTARMVALAGVPQEQINEWEDDIRSLAKQFGKSGAEAADALFFIVSAGLKGDDAMEALEVSLKASATGLGTVEEVATLATSAILGYGSDVISAAEATDILAAAAAASTFGPEELGAALNNVIPLAAEMGVTFDEAAGILAALAPSTNSAAEASTRMTSIMRALLAPSQQATKILDDAGTSADELNDIVGKKGLTEGMRFLEDALGGDVEAMSRVLGSSEALQGALGLLGRDAEEVDAILDSTADSSGRLDKSFGVVAETSAFQMDQAMAEIKDLLLDIGQTIIPVVIDALGQARDILARVTEAWQNLSPATQRWIVLAAGVIALVGPFLIGLGLMISALGKLLIAFGKVIKIFGFLSRLLLTNPWALVIAAIVLLVVAIVKNWDTIKAAISSAWNFVKKVTIKVWNAVVGFLKKNWKLILAVITGPLGALVILIASNWGKIKSTTTRIWNAIVDFVKRVPGRIASGIRSLIRKAKGIMNDVWNGARTATVNKVNSLIRFAKKIPGKIKNAIPNPINLLKSIGRSIIQGLINGLTSKLQDVRNLASSIGGIIKNLKGPEREDRKLLVPEGEAIMQGLIGGIESTLPELRSTLTGVTDQITMGGAPDITAPGVTIPEPDEPTRVTFDFTGIDSEMAKALRNTVRVEGGGDVQRAFGVTS